MYDNKCKNFDVWLALRCGADSGIYSTLREKCGSAYDVYNCSTAELEQMGLNESRVSALSDKSLDSTQRIINYCNENGVRIVTFGDKEYPNSLYTIENPPHLLYVKGRIPDLEKRLCVGMVGTRKCSKYGARMAFTSSYEMAAVGAVIVSGLAEGVDAISACGALSAGGDTVGVLGCSIDKIFPSGNAKLYAAVERYGMIISEYPPFSMTTRYSFPQRNRIISGLSDAVLVVEAGKRSGSLITANDAIRQGRALYAFPGNVGSSNSLGTNGLIRDGAYVALCGWDIIKNFHDTYKDTLNTDLYDNGCFAPEFNEEKVFSEYGISLGCTEAEDRENEERKPASKSKKRYKQVKDSTDTEEIVLKKAPYEKVFELSDDPQATEKVSDNSAVLDSLDPVERKVFELIPINGSISVDQISRSGVTIGEAISALTMLEIKDLVSSLPGGLYIRK